MPSIILTRWPPCHCSRGRSGASLGPYASVFVQDFNDTHGHAAVVALLDKAMALAESDAAKEPVAPPEPPDAEPEPSWRDQLPC